MRPVLPNLMPSATVRYLRRYRVTAKTFGWSGKLVQVQPASMMISGRGGDVDRRDDASEGATRRHIPACLHAPGPLVTKGSALRIPSASAAYKATDATLG